LWIIYVEIGMKPIEKIPIFPLGVVLFPEIPLPLHIFEERYKKMIRYCLDEQQPFGVVLYEDGKLYNKGCTAVITRLLNEYPDGRLDILAKGAHRFQLVDLIDEKAYLQALVEYFDDLPETDPAALKPLAQEGVTLLKQMATLHGQNIDVSLIDYFQPKTISYLIAASAGFTKQEEQAFLEMTSTKKRLERGIEALYKALERLKRTSKIDHRRNGRPPTFTP